MAWTVVQQPKNTESGWRFPSNTQHMQETSAVEDLNVDPEDMDLVPTDIQKGSDEWTIQAAPSD